MLITDINKLGEGIRARRKALGYTQTFLSEATGLSVSFISDLERGKATAEIGKVLRLIHLLGMDLTMTARDQAENIPAKDVPHIQTQSGQLFH